MAFEIEIETDSARHSRLRAADARIAALSSVRYAQSAWPVKPVTLVVPFLGGGGGTDAFTPPRYPKLDCDIKKDFVPPLLVVNPKNISGDFKALKVHQ